MIKPIFLLLVAVTLCLTTSAQLLYTFKDTSTPYVPLTGATSLNGTIIWDDEILSAPMPFSWVIDSDLSVNQFNLSLEVPGVIADTNDLHNINGFVLGLLDITDRGTINGTNSLSPIRYSTTGSSPNRIFKLELSNAGFFGELSLHHTMKDSFSVQIWVYEQSSIVEFHYGPSRITYPTDYYDFGSLFLGYGKHVNYQNFSSGNLYYLVGSPISPSVDTLVLPTLPSNGLNNWPASGKVYRFTPKSRNGAPNYIAGAVSTLSLQVYPTVTTNMLQVYYGLQEPIQYRIESTEGPVVNRGTIYFGLQTLDVSNLAPGTYLLQVQKTSANRKYRFVKN